MIGLNEKVQMLYVYIFEVVRHIGSMTDVARPLAPP
jgi:hypothetical protein